MLLEHEPRGHAQVHVLLQLSKKSAEEDRLRMLQLAAEKAVQSSDPDLLHAVISSACGGDPRLNRDLAKLISNSRDSLHMIGDVFAASLQRSTESDHLDCLRNFCQSVSIPRQEANCTVMQVFRRREPEDRMKWLRFAKDSFGKGASSAGDDNMSMQFCAQICSEEADLLRAQVALEQESQKHRWPNG